MTTEIEYALMASASYISTRADISKIPVPEGWLEKIDKRELQPSGFEATYFTKGTQIVISQTKGVSFAFHLESPRHVAHAIN